MRGTRGLIIAITVALLASATQVLARPRAADSAQRVPAGFIDMNLDQSALTSKANPGKQLQLIHESGVKRLRLQFNWSQAQPYASWNDVPADQRSEFTKGSRGAAPTKFGPTDLVVAAAATEKLSLMPVVEYAPHWDASSKGNHVEPAHDAPYGQYLSALVKRYGPKGSFWKEYPTIPRDPIVDWQIWNEPELGYFWDTFPFARSYVKLLRVAHHAIKAADPSATVVLAALTNHSWSDLESIYKIHGSRSLFNVVAADPYTRSARGVLTILGYIRKVMDKNGDQKKPLIATELGWPAAVGKTQKQFGFDTNTQGQATKLSQLMPLLVKNRQKLGLGAYYYYTWMTSYKHGAASPFAFSGLLRLHGSHVCAQPSFAVFRKDALSEEGAKAKGATPKRCSS